MDSTPVIDLVSSSPSGSSVITSQTSPSPLDSNSSSQVPESYIQLKTKDIHVYRQKLLKEQNYTCPICEVEIPKSGKGSALDHQHRRRKSDPIGLNGGGLIRGVLCRGCNIIEGKVWNNSHRFGKTHKDIPKMLRNMADYLEKKNYPWIHPKEAPKEPIVKKRKYNQLKKVMKQHKLDPPPELSKRQKLTKELNRLFQKFDIPPF